MKCPVCSNTLKQLTVDDITVDVCNGGCGGIWLDNFEIKKFDETHEAAGQSLLDVERDESLVIDQTKRVKCPKCNDIVMMRHFFSAKKRVMVDECPGCGGFWLNTGELGKIRTLFKTEQERDQAAHEYFDDVFGGQLAAMHAENKEKLQKTKNITNMFRFICPTYYIQGKQNWGAF